ncbi:secretion protein HlyD [Pseudomonas simiae]|nr:secretion protein HlyD [Pseudomonas simiae]
MNLLLLYPTLALISTCAFLTGCSQEEPLTQAVLTSPTYIAVARGRVDVEGGLLKLGVTREGVVTDIKVKEGDRVRKGQLLSTLDSELAGHAVSAALAEQLQIHVQAQQLERRYKLSDQKATRLAKAANAGASDGQSADDAREMAAQLHDELAKNRMDAETAKRNLATARYELAQRSLNAPVDAEVVRRLIQPGAAISPQSGPAFILLPNQPRIVRAELNESLIGAVHTGMKAEVTDESGSGASPLLAQVVRISAVLGNSALEDDPQVRANMRTVECILAFDEPAPESLRVGQRMLVRFGRQ